jgi:ABC-type protease/lipase transport system fused ATPase/permease subunit
VFSGVINILMLTGSFYMLDEVYDRVLPSRSVPTLIGLSLLAAGLSVFLGLLDLIRARVLWWQAMHVTACSAIAAGRCVDRPGADRACV